MSRNLKDHKAKAGAFYGALSLNAYCRDQARRAGKARARVEWHREGGRREAANAAMITFDFHDNLAERSRRWPMLSVPIGSAAEVAEVNLVRRSEPPGPVVYFAFFFLLLLVAVFVGWVGKGYHDGGILL